MTIPSGATEEALHATNPTPATGVVTAGWQLDYANDKSITSTCVAAAIDKHALVQLNRTATYSCQELT